MGCWFFGWVVCLVAIGCLVGRGRSFVLRSRSIRWLVAIGWVAVSCLEVVVGCLVGRDRLFVLRSRSFGWWVRLGLKPEANS